MRVLYVSKALVVAAYREKLREMGRLVDVRAVIPSRWGRQEPEPSPSDLPSPRRVRTLLHGHNHFHLYWRPGQWLNEGGTPDLVHVDEEPYSLVTAQLALECARAGVPFVFFAAQNVDVWMPPPFGFLRSRVYAAAAGGIAGTEVSASVLEQTGFPGPTEVIPQFGVDPTRFAPDMVGRRRVRTRLQIPESAFVVGYAGRLVPEKGIDVLFDAFARLRPGRADARMVVIGAGPEEKRLRQSAAAADTARRTHFVGWRPSLEMPTWLAALDVLVLPSVGDSTSREQFGRVLVEAMACGVPVVGSRCGEIPLVIGDAGEVVPRGDADALLGALERLLRDPGLRRELGERGRGRVLERFTHERIAADTVAFYEALAGVRSARGVT